MRIALLVKPALILRDSDLVLFDVRMPVMDGQRVAAAIRKQPGLEHTRIAAVTAYVIGGEGERVAAEGFDGYIQRPIDVEAFVGQVERFLPERPAPAQTAEEP